MSELQASHAELATRVQMRARDYIRRVGAEFPGDPKTGILDTDESAQERFSDFANDEACPRSILKLECAICINSGQ